MEDIPETLSDIDVNVHGFTEQDVIDNRMARHAMIRDGARRGNWFCEQAESLDRLAAQYGIDVTYSEELDEDDLE